MESRTGRQIGQKLGRDFNVTAVFAGNDELAMGIIRGLNDVGRRVPEDVSVVDSMIILSPRLESGINDYSPGFPFSGHEGC